MDRNNSITSCQISIRVRYCEVDRQNAVHHSVYPVYFEMGRTELLRINGLDYKSLEDEGVLLVVARLECRYRKAAHYDDELMLTTTLSRADKARLEHKYELIRPADNQLIAQGSTILVHIDKSGKLQPMPQFLTPV